MKQLLTTFTLIIVGSIAAFGSSNFLRITTVNGDSYFFSFERDPEITIQSDGLSVTTNDDQPATFTFENFSHFDFVDADPTLVESPAINMIWNAGTLTLTGIEPGTTVTLYTLDGKTILRQRANGSFQLDRNSLPKGIYILKADNLSVKIAI